MTPRVAFDEAVVFGAGAVGTLVGARLSGVVPTILVARGRHAECMERDGLRLSGTLNEHMRPTVARELSPARGRSLLIVAVKLGAMPDAAAAIAATVASDRVILTIQNGLEPDVELTRLLAERGAGALSVKRAVTHVACNLAAPGIVEYWGGGFTLPADTGYDDTASLFASAGMPVDRSSHFEIDVWTKLAVNCVANPLCALLGRRNNEVTVRELLSLRHAVCEEVTRLARSRGVVLRSDLAPWLDEALTSSLNRNSMLQDIAYGRRTEVDALNGAVDAIARDMEEDVPANRTLARLVRFLEEKAATAG